MAKVYIIQECDDSWSSDLEIVTATLDKKKAKELLTAIIKEHIETAKEQDDWEDIKADFSISQKTIRGFVNDLVEEENIHVGYADAHSADEFPGGHVWCEVVELE